jgi:hypothetical protein
MAKIPQIRGMLLEEAVLYLLRVSGYHTVEQADSDRTLRDGHAGLEVRGRGGIHQIDAIADYSIAHPFSYPQRLLVEAKFYAAKPVGVEIVRNAVGVLKDVEEYWTSSDSPFNTRYHYLFVLASASGFTSGAEKYAFAHDIYLMPLAQSQFIKPIIDAILNIRPESFGVAPRRNIEVSITELRRAIRRRIRYGDHYELRQVVRGRALEHLDGFCDATREINGAILGMIAKRFPIFLVPSRQIDLSRLRSRYQVRIRWDQGGWYLRSADEDNLLFSFDLPPDLFILYASEEGVLTAPRALDLKAEYLREIQAIVTVGQRPHLVTFQLDLGWIDKLRERARIRSEERNRN